VKYQKRLTPRGSKPSSTAVIEKHKLTPLTVIRAPYYLRGAWIFGGLFKMECHRQMFWQLLAVAVAGVAVAVVVVLASGQTSTQ